MKFRTLILVALALVLSAGAAPPASSLSLLNLGSTVNNLTGTVSDLTSSIAETRHIVTATAGADVDAIARDHDLEVIRQFSAAFEGFATMLTPADKARLAADPRVELVANDSVYLLGQGGVLLQVLSSVTGEILSLLGSTQLLSVLGIANPPSAVAHVRPTITPQEAPTGVRRIGGLHSATAAIDGIDSRIDADIAIIDTGVEHHPDLNVVGGHDCTSTKTTSYGDARGHGTHVAGIAAAIDNGYGIVGVAPGARIWAVKVMDDHGIATLLSIACGLEWVAANADTIEVANAGIQYPISLGDGSCGILTLDLMHRALCTVVSRGVTVTTPAGNNATASLSAPASFDEAIVVSGLADSDGAPGGAGPLTCVDEPDDTFDAYSGFGKLVDIAAPSECILSTLPNGYGLMTGTSQASPHVAGAAALLHARYPGISPASVRQKLLAESEAGPIVGDPDGYPEGVVHVSDL